jgi:uncharacterized coiled-coil DUF342 family protein
MVTMPLEGAEVLGELNAGLDRARATLAECQGESGRLDGQMHDLLARRGEALLKLARHYLPEFSRPAIESTFDGIRSDLLGILAQREARRNELQTQLEQADGEARRRNAEVDDVTRRLNEKVALREQLKARVAEILKGNADFQERSRLALQAEEKLHRDEKRVEEMARESAEKLPQYDGSRMFRYLYDRGYGTPEYQSARWVRSIDRWVADLIDFPKAREGYEFLKKTPELVAAEVSRRRDLFQELRGQVEAIEKAEADKAGLTAVLQEGDALGTDRDRLVREMERFQEQAQGFQQGLAELERAQNDYYNQAIERFRAFLGETRVAVLQRRARQTPGPEDDAIVAELARLDDQIDGIGPRLENLSGRRSEADRVQEGLDRVIRKFRQANYDSDRSFFEDLDLRREVARFEDGSIGADDLWRAIESTQKFRPNWVASAASEGVQFAASPAGQVIIGAIVNIAGSALSHASEGGTHHQSDASGSSFPTSDAYQAPSPPAPDPPSPSSEGGFTSGEGF